MELLPFCPRYNKTTDDQSTQLYCIGSALHVVDLSIHHHVYTDLNLKANETYFVQGIPLCYSIERQQYIYLFQSNTTTFYSFYWPITQQHFIYLIGQ